MRWWMLLAVFAACEFRKDPSPLPAFDAAAIDSSDPCAGQPRYRIGVTARSWLDAEAECEATGAHLAVLETDVEVAAIGTMLPNGDKHWVGAVQGTGQAAPRAGWFWITGPEVAVLWKANKPDDGGPPEDADEQVSALDRTGIDDDDHTDEHVYVCECDGKAVAPAVRALFPPVP